MLDVIVYAMSVMCTHNTSSLLLYSHSPNTRELYEYSKLTRGINDRIFNLIKLYNQFLNNTNSLYKFGIIKEHLNNTEFA